MAVRIGRRGGIAQRCSICGGFPAGIHFGGLSCEGCMAFFKRNLEKGPNLRCYFGKNCELKLENVEKKDRSKFTTCKACRFQKCLEQGMNPEVAARGKAYTKKKTGVSANIPPDENLSIDIQPRSQDTPSSQYKSEKSELSNPTDSTCADRDLMQIRPETIAERFLPLHLSVMDLGALISLPKISDIRPGKENYLPPFLRKYHTLLEERNSFLLDTALTVEHAAFCAFNDQIQSWSTFMHRAINFGEVPVQPEQSVELTIAYLAGALFDQQSRTANFASLLPGYCEYESLKEKHLLTERFSEVFVIHYSAYVENDELYVQIGPRKAHMCRYWRDQLLNKDYHRLSWSLIHELKNIELTMSERYVLLAACLFKPKTRDSATLNCLYCLYLNVLEYLIKSRSMEAHLVIARMRAFVDRLEAYQRLHEKYMPRVESSEAIDPAIFSAVLSKDEELLPDQS